MLSYLILINEFQNFNEMTREENISYLKEFVNPEAISANARMAKTPDLDILFENPIKFANGKTEWDFDKISDEDLDACRQKYQIKVGLEKRFSGMNFSQVMSALGK